MAEIRSTLEMVLERAARLEAEAGDNPSTEAKSQEGMRLAAQYLRGEEVDFAALLNKPAAERSLLVQGALNVLMRNINLPREGDDQTGTGKAMMGMLQLGQDPQLRALLEEVQTVLGQYIQHKEQLYAQLEEQFAQHMGALEQSVSGQTGVDVKLEPSQHPKFAEEWQKVMVQLNEKYGAALDQHKSSVQKLLLV